MPNQTKSVTQPLTESDVKHLETIEALFFAYRDFVEGPDKILEALEFGRAHHRVLYFVNRKPGLTVAELLEILKITKQSLARVLKQLIDAGYIAQTEGRYDRRKRLLHPTPLGRELILKLSQSQTHQITAAIDKSDGIEIAQIAEFLKNMAASE